MIIVICFSFILVKKYNFLYLPSLGRLVSRAPPIEPPSCWNSVASLGPSVVHYRVLQKNMYKCFAL